MSQLNLRTVLSGDNIGNMIDKINYNFQQIVLGGGGPEGKPGIIGPPGGPGPIGPTGGPGPTGGTGTYVFVGVTAPNSLSSILPTPRVQDVYLQPDNGAGVLNFWEKIGTGATGWQLVDSLAVSEGVFTTAIDPAGGGTATNAAFAKTSAAANFFVGDLNATTTLGLLFQDLSTREFESFLSQSTSQWLAGFANPGNQIRFVNSDPTQIGTLNPLDKTGKYAGVNFSLETTSVGGAEMLLTINDARLTGTTATNKLFSIKLNDDANGTTSFYADTANNAAVGAVEGDTLNDKFSVFGTQLVYEPTSSRLLVDSDTSTGVSRLQLSIGETEGSLERSWAMKLAAGANLKLDGIVPGASATAMVMGLTTGDSRVTATGLVSVGGIDPVSDLEVGSVSDGRLGFGQMEPAATNLFAKNYIGFNAFRYRGGPTASNWLMRGGSLTASNGAAAMMHSSEYDLLGINLYPAGASGNNLVSTDAWLASRPLFFKKGSTASSSATKLFIDSFGYASLTGSQIDNAPHLVIGATVAANLRKFNFGNTASGIGLYGPGNSIEWIGATNSGNDSKASGFRMIQTERTSPGLTHSIFSLQARGYDDTAWRDAIRIYNSPINTGATANGTVLIGGFDYSGLYTGSSIVPDSILTVKGHGSGSSTLMTTNLLDIQAGGSTGPSVFKLDPNGNVISGLIFGSPTYDSSNRYTLDHYDEGTWTPQIWVRGKTVEGYTASTGLGDYHIVKSNYTRVGNKVTIDLGVNLYPIAASNIPGSTAADVYLRGLPFRPDFENMNSTYGVNSATELAYPLIDMSMPVKQFYAVGGGTVPSRGAKGYGSFVLDGAKTKLYLYKDSSSTPTIGNFQLSDIGTTASTPGSGISYTYLNGIFEYFISDLSSGPLYTGATSGSFVLGATSTTFSGSFDYDTNPISSISVSALPAWLTYSSISQQFSIVPGATVTTGTTPFTVDLVATDNTGLTGTGAFTYSLIAGTIPTMVPQGYTGATGPVSGGSGNYTTVIGSSPFTITATSTIPMLGMTVSGFLNGGPSGITSAFTTEVILNSGTESTLSLYGITGASGIYTITATATNAIGSTDQSYYLKVQGTTASPMTMPLTASFTWDNTDGDGGSGIAQIFVYEDASADYFFDSFTLPFPGQDGGPKTSRTLELDLLDYATSTFVPGTTYWVQSTIIFDEAVAGPQNILTTSAGANGTFINLNSGASNAYVYQGPLVGTSPDRYEWNTPVPYGLTFSYGTASGNIITIYAKTTSVDPSCPDPMTPISVSIDQTVLAGDIQTGDMIYAMHETTKEFGMFRVTSASPAEQPKLYIRFTDGSDIKVSETHKFYMANEEWMVANQLVEGLAIKGVENDKVVESIESIGTGTVIRLEIEDAHTYISNGLISHNKTP